MGHRFTGEELARIPPHIQHEMAKVKALDQESDEAFRDRIMREAATTQIGVTAIYREKLQAEQDRAREATRDWPRDCPKCGYRGKPTRFYCGVPEAHDGAFQVRYCRERSQTLGCWIKAAWLVPVTKGEHLHHECRECGLELMTRCVDAAPLA